MNPRLGSIGLWLFVLLGAFAKEPPTTLQLSVKLRDGSFIMGTIKDEDLTVTSEAIGVLKIPLSRITAIKVGAAAKPDSITLANGDRLQGEARMTRITLETVFGAATVPKELVTEVALRAKGAAKVVVDWEKLPFETDSDWPGDRGQAAEIQEDGTIILHGRPILSTDSYSLPLTIEYDLTFPEPTAPDGAFHIAAYAPDQATDMNPRKFVLFTSGFRNQNLRNGNVACTELKNAVRGAPFWSNESVSFSAGKPYHCRLQLTANGAKWEIGDESFDISRAVVPYEKFRIWMRGWRTTDPYRIENFSIR